jgi:hypothetical protein
MSTLTESLAQDRHAARYQRRSQSAARAHTETPKLQGPRRRAGWLLVGLGLRLALPGSQDAAQRISLIGH